MKQRVFIAVPGTAHPNSYTRHQADLVMQMLSRSGYEPVNPLHNNPGKNSTEADVIADQVRMALGCHQVYFCAGWGRDCACSVVFHAVREWNSIPRHVEKIKTRYGNTEVA